MSWGTPVTLASSSSASVFTSANCLVYLFVYLFTFSSFFLVKLCCSTEMEVQVVVEVEVSKLCLNNRGGTKFWEFIG